MIFILAGALLIGVSAAALVALPFRLMRKPIPKGILPIAGGVALVSFVLWNDYSWFDRTRSELPERVVVLDEARYSGAIQPWTLAFPRVNAFVAMDPNNARRNEGLPGIVMVDVYYLRRYAPTLTSAHLVDCNERRSANMPNEPDFAEDGMPLNLEWRDGTVDTALVEALCA